MRGAFGTMEGLQNVRIPPRRSRHTPTGTNLRDMSDGKTACRIDFPLTSEMIACKFKDTFIS